MHYLRKILFLPRIRNYTLSYDEGDDRMSVREKYYRIFCGPYAASDIRIQKKAAILAPTAIVISCMAVLLSAVMALTGAYTVAGILVGLVALCLAVLFALAKGRYETSSSLFMYTLLVAMFAAVKFDAYRDVYETYVFATLGLFFMILVGLVGARPFHAYLAIAGTLAGMAAIYVLDALPKDGGKVTLLAVQNLATCSVLAAAGGLVTAMTIRMQNSLVAETRASAESSQDQYERLSLAVAKANEGAYRISQELAAASEALSSSTRQFRAAVLEETSGLAALDDTLAMNAREEDAVIGSQERVLASLDSYSRKVLEAGAAIEQMISSIGSLGESAGDRRAGIEQLSALARDGRERVAELARGIETIVEATASMGEMNTLIGDVAARTNLLGMNASIEAAHAGAAGRGFAVVAEEIRSLSEEAGKGSRSIGAILKDSRKAVEAARRAGEETSAFFARMTDEVGRVSETLADFVGKLQELSAGTSGISNAIAGFSSLADQTGNEAKETGRTLRKVAEFSSSSREVARVMREDATSMLASCDSLLAKAAAVSELGRENIRQMEALKAAVAAVASPVEGVR